MPEIFYCHRMKNTFLILLFLFPISPKGYCAVDFYETLYTIDITLINGDTLTGSFYHSNYESQPPYSFNNDELLIFIKKVTEKKGTLEVYRRLQDLKFPQGEFFTGKTKAVAKEDLRKIKVSDIKLARFIDCLKFTGPDSNWIIVKELTQAEINNMNRGANLLFELYEPDAEKHMSEAGFLHVLIGNSGVITMEEFRKELFEVYNSTGEFSQLDIKKYMQLRKKYEDKGLTMLTFYETPYFTSNVFSLEDL